MDRETIIERFRVQAGSPDWLHFPVPASVKPLLSNAGSITGDDTYSLVLREMTLGTPSKLELVDWMLEMDDDDSGSARSANDNLMQTARSVLTGTGIADRLIPVRSLMLAMLYPSPEDAEQLRQLRQAGASPRVLLQTEAILTKYRYLLSLM